MDEYKIEYWTSEWAMEKFCTTLEGSEEDVTGYFTCSANNQKEAIAKFLLSETYSKEMVIKKVLLKRWVEVF